MPQNELYTDIRHCTNNPRSHFRITVFSNRPPVHSQTFLHFIPTSSSLHPHLQPFHPHLVIPTSHSPAVLSTPRHPYIPLSSRFIHTSSSLHPTLQPFYPHLVIPTSHSLQPFYPHLVIPTSHSPAVLSTPRHPYIPLSSRFIHTSSSLHPTLQRRFIHTSSSLHPTLQPFYPHLVIPTSQPPAVLSTPRHPYIPASSRFIHASSSLHPNLQPLCVVITCLLVSCLSEWRLK